MGPPLVSAEGCKISAICTGAAYAHAICGARLLLLFGNTQPHQRLTSRSRRALLARSTRGPPWCLKLRVLATSRYTAFGEFPIQKRPPSGKLLALRDRLGSA